MSSKDDAFLAGKKGLPRLTRSAPFEAKITKPVRPHKPKVLSPQEWKFVEEFCSEDGRVSLRELALRAGYGSGWAHNRATELTDPEKNPHIVLAIQQRRKELAEKYGTTYERHMRDLQMIRDQALQAGAYGAAVQAEYRRGQALGSIYIERREVRHGTIDSMSREEVKRKLEEIKRLYGQGPIIDVTPEQLEADPEVAELPEVAEPQDVAAENDEEAVAEDGADEARDEAVPPIERKHRFLPYIPD